MSHKKVKYSINISFVFTILSVSYILFKRNRLNGYFNLFWSDSLTLFGVDVKDPFTYVVVSCICVGAGIFGILRNNVVDAWLYCVVLDPSVKKVEGFSKLETYYYIGKDEICEMIAGVIGIGSSIVQVDFFVYTLVGVLITLFFVIREYTKDKTFEEYPDYYTSMVKNMLFYFGILKRKETLEEVNVKNDSVNFELQEIKL